MVLSGAQDPLNDAGGRARQLKSCCPDMKMVLVEAGHCPHDEQPGIINAELLGFLVGIADASHHQIKSEAQATRAVSAR